MNIKIIGLLTLCILLTQMTVSIKILKKRNVTIATNIFKADAKTCVGNATVVTNPNAVAINLGNYFKNSNGNNTPLDLSVSIPGYLP